MGMCMGVNFHYPMGMDTSVGVVVGVIFKNGYGCGFRYGYDCTRPVPIPIPVLTVPVTYLFLPDF